MNANQRAGGNSSEDMQPNRWLKVKGVIKEDWRENNVFFWSIPCSVIALVIYVVVHCISHSHTARFIASVVSIISLLPPLLHLLCIGMVKNIAAGAKVPYIFFIIWIAVLIFLYQILDSKWGRAFVALIMLLTLMHGATSVIPTLFPSTTSSATPDSSSKVVENPLIIVDPSSASAKLDSSGNDVENLLAIVHPSSVSATSGDDVEYLSAIMHPSSVSATPDSSGDDVENPLEIVHPSTTSGGIATVSSSHSFLPLAYTLYILVSWCFSWCFSWALPYVYWLCHMSTKRKTTSFELVVGISSQNTCMQLSTTATEPHTSELSIRKPKKLEEMSVGMMSKYLTRMPLELKAYVTNIIDVQSDGNCGYRCVAALLGLGESSWCQIRKELYEELN